MKYTNSGFCVPDGVIAENVADEVSFSIFYHFSHIILHIIAVLSFSILFSLLLIGIYWYDSISCHIIWIFLFVG